MNGTIAYALARKYAQKLSCGIQSSSYDPATSTMTVNLNDGSSYGIVFDDGVSTKDRETLDNISYDEDTNALQVNGVEVLTKENVENENIDFSNMF